MSDSDSGHGTGGPSGPAVFAPAVASYLERHAVDVELAHALGVRSDRDDILYPYSRPRGGTFVRRRVLATGITQQPSGEPLVPWFPAGRPAAAGDVLLTEGEPDALAALSSLNGDPFTVCAIPGTSIPPERLTAELAGAGRVYLAMDGDEAGRKAVDRIARALQQYTELRIVKVGEGEDLASRLYREEDREGWLREALSSAQTAAKLKLKPETGGYRKKKTDRTRDLLAKGIDPQRIDGVELLDEIEAFIRRFVVFISAAAPRVIALWVLHSHAIAAADATPYLGIISPTKRCGKTRLEEVLQLLARNAWKIDGAPSEATLFRKIEKELPALLLDEADALWAGGDVRTEPLRAIFNSGNRRGATVPRCIGEGKNQEVHDFSVFCPKVLSGIKTTRWPDTVLDRCFLIPLRRKTRGETVERLRVRKVGPKARPSTRRRRPGRRPTCRRSPMPSPTCPRSSTTGRRTERSRCSRSPTLPGACGLSSLAPRCSSYTVIARSRTTPGGFNSWPTFTRPLARMSVSPATICAIG